MMAIMETVRKMFIMGETTTVETIPTGETAPKALALTGAVAIWAPQEADTEAEILGGRKRTVRMLIMSEKTRIPASER